MRLIDANALWEQISNAKPNDVLALIEDAPTVDAVPVVRCKDCTYWGRNAETQTHKDCMNLPFMTPPGFYCKWGERREE